MAKKGLGGLQQVSEINEDVDSDEDWDGDGDEDGPMGQW